MRPEAGRLAGVSDNAWVAAREQGRQVVDLLDYVCQDGDSKIAAVGVRVYTERIHVSATFSLLGAPYLVKRLRHRKHLTSASPRCSPT